MQYNKKIFSIYFHLNKICLYLRMELQDEKILRKHFTDLFEDSLDEDVDYIRIRIFDVIMSLGGLNGLVGELINNTEWDFHTLKSLQEEYL